MHVTGLIVVGIGNGSLHYFALVGREGGGLCVLHDVSWDIFFCRGN